MIYEQALKYVLENGEFKKDRTGTGTISFFGLQIKYSNIVDDFPLITTKKIFTKGFIEELLWFLKGSTNSKELEDKGVNIWKAWAKEDGELGKIYGYQWTNWNGLGINQIKNVIRDITTNPHSRRHLVSAWNVGQIEEMALPPCHYSFQFYADTYDGLSILVNQRSADLFLGVPFNIASYSLLLSLIAREVGRIPKNLILNLGDAHIYKNHIEQVEEQLTRDIRLFPKLVYNTNNKNTFKYKSSDFIFDGYKPHPTIKGEISV